MREVPAEQISITFLAEIEGAVHLLAMEKESYEALSDMVKAFTVHAVPTSHTQEELRKFLNVDV